jgi:SAM-dependent methyltransferase
MPDYYTEHFRDYFQKTIDVNPSSFLTPLVQRLAPGAKILDVGCGSGRDLLWFKNRGFSAVGFERSSGLADLAREHSGCSVIEGDFEQYDFSALSFDAVVFSGALVHVPHERFSKVLENSLHALKPRGLCFVSLKEGTGTKTDSAERVFYLWNDTDLRPVFKRLHLDVLAFSRQASVLGTGEIWLGYILQKALRDEWDSRDRGIIYNKLVK